MVPQRCVWFPWCFGFPLGCFGFPPIYDRELAVNTFNQLKPRNGGGGCAPEAALKKKAGGGLAEVNTLTKLKPWNKGQRAVVVVAVGGGGGGGGAPPGQPKKKSWRGAWGTH